MLSAAGCYGTTTDGATRGRAYGGNVTRGRAYSGAYDNLYRDGNRSGYMGDGAHAIDGAMRENTPRAHSGITRGHKYRRAHDGATRGRAHHGTHHGAAARNHHGNRPMVDGLEYVR